MNMEQQPGSPKKSPKNLDVKAMLGAIGLAALAGIADQGSEQVSPQRPAIERAESEHRGEVAPANPEGQRSAEPQGERRIVTEGFVLEVGKPESVVVVTSGGGGGERLEARIVLALPGGQVVSTFVSPGEAGYLQAGDYVSVTYLLYPPEEGEKTPYLHVESVSPRVNPA